MPLVPGRGFVPPDPVNLVTGRAWKRAVLGDRPTQAAGIFFRLPDGLDVGRQACVFCDN